MTTRNIIKKNTYLDSIMLMSISSTLKNLESVEEVSTIMGTDANKEILKNSGLLTGVGKNAGAGDLIIALRVKNESDVKPVIDKAEELFTRRAAESGGEKDFVPISYESAVNFMPSANIAVISLPGRYAGREAMAVLESGRHVMIFSDNVPLEEEIQLKKRARELDLLVMGPDCGTAILNGTALGFANVVRKGPIGIIGASGTGIQEVTALIHNKSHGISQAIGLGGRDLSEEVGGISMIQGIEALENDPETEVIVLISKPPAAKVANKIFDVIRDLKKKYVVNFLKGDPAEAKKRKLLFASGLEDAAELAVSALENRDFIYRDFSDDEAKIKAQAGKEKARIGTGKYVRGLFSGGTLADEALLILSREIGDIYSNIPLKKELALKDRVKSQHNTIVDLGEDEFTRGRPHPMIDYSLRCGRLLEEAEDPDCGVILFDVVLGYGSHPDPAQALVPAIDKAHKIARDNGRNLAFVASITGTDRDPQNLSGQAASLKNAGVTILPSNAQAARYTGLIVK
ncbi:MAG TPA: acyl-CoA synthetase FdrA [Spirochaetes bacterium]|nr:acyl-CoA synthetase FdrA [Spirochaetota bacterium]